MTFSSLLVDRCRELGIERTDLRERLEQHGQKVSRQRAWEWFNGGRAEPEMLPAFCEVLNLDAEGAAALYASCGILLPESLQPRASA